MRVSGESSVFKACLRCDQTCLLTECTCNQPDLTRVSKCTCTKVVFPDPAIPRHKIQVGFSFWESELAIPSPLTSDVDGPAKELFCPPLASAILELRWPSYMTDRQCIAGSIPYQFLSRTSRRLADLLLFDDWTISMDKYDWCWYLKRHADYSAVVLGPSESYQMFFASWA